MTIIDPASTSPSNASSAHVLVIEPEARLVFTNAIDSTRRPASPGTRIHGG